jgi:hypothetical protein
MSVVHESAVTDGKKRTPKAKAKPVHTEVPVVAEQEATNGEFPVEIEAHAVDPVIVNGEDHTSDTASVETEAGTETETKEPKPKGTRQRLPRYADDQVITVLKPDAKSGAASIRYNVYQTGMTIKEYVDIMTAEPHSRSVGEVWNDIRWDTDPKRNLIHVGPEVVDIPPPPPPKVAKPRKKKAEAATEDQEAEQPAAA